MSKIATATQGGNEMPDVAESRTGRSLTVHEAAAVSGKSPFTLMSRSWRLAQGFPTERDQEGRLVVLGGRHQTLARRAATAGRVTLAAFLGRLRGVRPARDQFVARCPGHEDGRPSLLVGERDGKILVYCRSHRCRPEEILSPLGLRLADLFADARPRFPAGPRASESPLQAARREIVAAARRQAWARPGMLEMYAVADGLRALRRRTAEEQARASVLGDTELGWRAVWWAAFMEREANLIEAEIEELAA